MQDRTIKSEEMSQSITYGFVPGNLLAKNSILNLLGKMLPLLVGIVAIPFSIKGLGKEGFGILSIAWVVLGYFSLFDFGLAQATTKFVAEILGKKEIEKLPSIFWTAIIVSFALGVIGAVILFFITPYLIETFFKIPYALMHQAKVSFYMLAISLPIVLSSTSLRGALGAAQRFDLVNLIVIPTSMLTFIFPGLSFPFHLNLSTVIFLIILSRIAAALSYLLFCFKVFPILKTKPGKILTILKKMLSYGGWVTITNIISPLLVYMDRFFIGSLFSMSAVTFYTVPYEVITRTKILPSSLMTTIFPEFSAASEINNVERIETLICRSFKYISITMGLLAVLLFFYAPNILNIWLGADFVEKSSGVFKILVIGVFLNSLALIPFTLLQGIGRPDLPAKFHLIEFPVYLILLWFLITSTGIIGAALAWTIRIIMDTILLFSAALKFYPLSRKVINENRIGQIFLLLMMLSLFIAFISNNISSFFIEIFLVLAISLVSSWIFIVDEKEKMLLFYKFRSLFFKEC